MGTGADRRTNRTGRLTRPGPLQLVIFTVLLVGVLYFAAMELFAGWLLAR